MDRSRYSLRESFGDYWESSRVTPNYHKRKAAGEFLPPLPYYFGRWDVKTPLSPSYNGTNTERDISSVSTFNASAYAGYYTLPTGAKKGPSFDGIYEIHAILGNKLLDKVRNSPVDLGVALGEYRETANLAVGAMKTAADMYRAVRKHDFSLALRHLTGRNNRKSSDAAKAAADAWLGFTYGVKPLMSDVYGSIELLSNPNPWVGVQTVRTSHKSSFWSGADYDSGQDHTARGWTQGSLNGTAKMQYFVDNPLLFTMDQVGVVNPLSIGWELIPFSFVCDWFIPVGGFLRGIVPPQGVKFLTGYTYVKGRGTAYQRTDIKRPAPGLHTEATTREFVKDRRVLTSFPRYTLIVPDLSPTYNKLMSAMSLLTQLRLR